MWIGQGDFVNVPGRSSSHTDSMQERTFATRQIIGIEVLALFNICVHVGDKLGLLEAVPARCTTIDDYGMRLFDGLIRRGAM